MMPLRTAFDPPSPEESPQDAVARIEGMGEIRKSPCGSGFMIWRVWGDGPPLVLLHGGYGSWLHWLRNIPVFAAHFKVLAATMPGFGDSDDMPEPHTAASLAAAVSAGIDQLLPSGERFHMAGFSFGGIIGGRVAALQGERVLSHTFSGSSGMGLTRNTLEPFKSWRAAKSDEERLAAHRRNLEILMIADPKIVDDLALYIQNWNTQRGRVKSHIIGNADNLSDALPDVKGRLMGLYGARDAYSQGHLQERIDYLGAFQPNLVFRTLEGAGHWACYEAAETFNEIYFNMLDEIGEGPNRRISF